MRLQSLGDLRLVGPAGDVLPRRRKELALLVYLATEGARPVRRQQLQALFWGERTEEKARNSLRQALLKLRRAIPAGLEVGPQEVRLAPDALELDTRAFEQAVAAGDDEAAVALWAGELLPEGDELGGEAFRVWLEVERARLRRTLDTAFERIVARHEAAADWAGMAHRAERWAVLRPLEERPHLRQIEALRLGGRSDEALARADAFERRLLDELGDGAAGAWRGTVAQRASETVRASAVSAAHDGSGRATRAAAFGQLVAAWRAVQGGGARRLLLESVGDDHRQVSAQFLAWLEETGQDAFVLRAHGQAAPVAAAALASGRAQAGAGDDARGLLAGLRDAPGLGGADDRDLAELALYVPALRDRYARLPAATGADAAGALARTLEAVSEERPTVVLAQDVDGMDGDSRTLLEDAARQLRGRVLLLRTRRVRRWSRVRRLEPDGECTRLRLVPERAAVPRPPARSRAYMAVVVALSVLAWGMWLARWLMPRTPVAAVGSFSMLDVPDSLRAVPLLLGTALARVRGLSVVSDGRLQEVLAQIGSGAEPPAGRVERAARIAGASEVVEGILSRRAGGTLLRLDLRIVDAKSGATRGAYTVESADAFDLVDLATERIARGLDGEVPSSRSGASATSLVAYRLYENGLRAWNQADGRTARRFFLAALAEDSTFAMAAYYAARLSDTPDLWTLMARAARMSRYSTERERLLILASCAAAMQDPAQLAYAETLAVRYPTDPDGQLAYAQALVTAGRYLEAVPHFRAVVTMDSLALHAQALRCRACEAYDGMAVAFKLADSLTAAERTAREWVRRQPDGAAAWSRLADPLTGAGRYEDALRALRTSATLAHSDRLPEGALTDILLRQGDFQAVDRDWQAALAAGTPDEQEDALSTAVLSLRTQGRLRDALAAALRVRRLATQPATTPLGNAYLEAMVLFELGRFREAAALFDSMAAEPGMPSPARTGRAIAWNLTHAATAYAAAGDTARLGPLEDSVRVAGARSSFGRDRLLFHYVHGLRLRARGQLAAAAEAFQQSLVSPVEGNTRASLELARTLLALGQPARAASVLGAALAGPIGASGQYANRTELEELLGRAQEALGERDRALAAYRWALHARALSDATFAPERAALERRVATLAARSTSGARAATSRPHRRSTRSELRSSAAISLSRASIVPDSARRSRQ